MVLIYFLSNIDSLSISYSSSVSINSLNLLINSPIIHVPYRSKFSSAMEIMVSLIFGGLLGFVFVIDWLHFLHTQSLIATFMSSSRQQRLSGIKYPNTHFPLPVLPHLQTLHTLFWTSAWVHSAFYTMQNHVLFTWYSLSVKYFHQWSMFSLPNQFGGSHSKISSHLQVAGPQHNAQCLSLSTEFLE